MKAPQKRAKSKGWAGETGTCTLSLDLPARSGMVPAARAMVLSCLRECGFGRTFCDDMELALDEALQNIIKHTYLGDVTGRIGLSLAIRDKKVRISLSDDGPSFDPSKIPKVNLKAYMKEKKRGGLGVLLMRKLMDKVSYQPGKLKGNLLVLEKSARSLEDVGAPV